MYVVNKATVKVSAADNESWGALLLLTAQYPRFPGHSAACCSVRVGNTHIAPRWLTYLRQAWRLAGWAIEKLGT